MTAEYITSRKNPLMVQIRKLASSRSYRREQGLYLGDGLKLVQEALRWKAPLQTVVVSQGISLSDVPDSVRVVEVPEDVMASISPMESPQGALLVGFQPERRPPVELAGGRYLVLDGLQDPGNVGTIWRTADALGADGLLLVHRCADPFSPKTVRATMGACFRLPVYELETEELPGLLERSGLPLYATALREDTVDIRQVDLGRCAVVIGSEGQGISQELLALSQKTLKIPMRERCESLNAAAAASIVLWEMGR
ncbi:RNA methyltransferase [Flavonifractor sp. An100]|uniref:TrmH family RNA methyltransferase n=1 Tax=Flavonifractor sp. An100 TaxID=1965538 RepID=UPI001FA930DA|nr:RNA methyltransferase [Flavonifractor sp. An100]